MQIILVESDAYRWYAPFLPPSMRGGLTETQLLYGAVDEQSGTAVGAMLVEAEESVVAVQWIRVADPWRRRGVARQLVAALCEDAVASPAIAAIRAQMGSRDTIAVALLRHCGFRVRPSLVEEYIFPLSEVRQSAFWHRPVPCTGTIQPLGTVPPQAVQAFNARIAAGDKLRGVEPICMEECDSTLSLCCLVGGRIVGVLLAGSGGPVLELSWLYADASQPRAAAALLQQAAEIALRLYPEQTNVHLAAITDEAKAMVDKLLPRAKRRNGAIAWYDVAATRRAQER